MSDSVLSRRRFLGGSTAALAAQCGALRSAIGQELTPAISEPSSYHLFLDETVIDRLEGLERRVHRPKKTGLIQEADGRPWELGDQLWVVRDVDGKFHMGYRVVWPDPAVRGLDPRIGDDKAHWFRQARAYATSEDGIRWEKPVLNLMDGPTGFRPAPREKWADGVFYEPVAMSRKSNLGCPFEFVQDLKTFGNARREHRRYLVNEVIFDDTHPFAGIKDGGLYLAPDVPRFVNNPRWNNGLEVVWEGARKGPHGPATRVAGWDPLRRLWFECGQSSFAQWTARGGRDISRWSTRDFMDWSDEELVLPVRPEESRTLTDWIEYMDFRAMPWNDLWLGQLVVFHGDRSSDQYEMPTKRGVWRKGTTDMRLMLSRDGGRSWRSLTGRQPWIPNHEAEDGFDRLVFTASPVHVGEELWLYYSCWDGDHLVWNRDGTPFYKDRTRIPRTARAVMRWDGYVSLRPEGTTGRVFTQPRPIKRRLEVNAAVNPGGSVKVEIIDPMGTPVSGLRLKDCTPLTGSGLSQAVSWGGKTEVARKNYGKQCRLQFEVTNADLYGFEWVG